MYVKFFPGAFKIQVLYTEILVLFVPHLFSLLLMNYAQRNSFFPLDSKSTTKKHPNFFLTFLYFYSENDNIVVILIWVVVITARKNQIATAEIGGNVVIAK
jgi:hypothetical protein